MEDVLCAWRGVVASPFGNPVPLALGVSAEPASYSPGTVTLGLGDSSQSFCGFGRAASAAGPLMVPGLLTAGEVAYLLCKSCRARATILHLSISFVPSPDPALTRTGLCTGRELTLQIQGCVLGV